MSLVPSLSVAAIKRPSGEQTGNRRFVESGTADSWAVVKSRFISGVSFSPRSENTIIFPALAQLGRMTASDLPGNLRGVPPGAGTTYKLGGNSQSPSEKAICFPSGDQRGQET